MRIFSGREFYSRNGIGIVKKKKRKKKQKYVSKKLAEKNVYDTRLLSPKALMAVIGFLDYPIDDYTYKQMERLFREYKDKREEVKKAILGAFQHLLHESTLEKRKLRTKEKVRMTKKEINAIAKKVWR